MSHDAHKSIQNNHFHDINPFFISLHLFLFLSLQGSDVDEISSSWCTKRSWFAEKESRCSANAFQIDSQQNHRGKDLFYVNKTNSNRFSLFIYSNNFKLTFEILDQKHNG